MVCVEGSVWTPSFYNSTVGTCQCHISFQLIDGSVSETGTYRQLIANAGAFAEFLEEYLIEEAKHRTASISAEDDESTFTSCTIEITATSRGSLASVLQHINR
jgi:hypothetical protein